MRKVSNVGVNSTSEDDVLVSIFDLTVRVPNREHASSTAVSIHSLVAMEAVFESNSAHESEVSDSK